MLPYFKQILVLIPKPAWDSFLYLLIEILNSPNQQLQKGLTELCHNEMACSPLSQARLLFIKLCELATTKLAKNNYYNLFKLSLSTFSKESNTSVLNKFCQASAAISFKFDFELHSQGGWQYRARQNHFAISDIIKSQQKNLALFSDREQRLSSQHRLKRTLET